MWLSFVYSRWLLAWSHVLGRAIFLLHSWLGTIDVFSLPALCIAPPGTMRTSQKRGSFQLSSSWLFCFLTTKTVLSLEVVSFLKFVYLHLWVCVNVHACIHTGSDHRCQRGLQIIWSWSYRLLWAVRKWVLGPGLSSSGRVQALLTTELSLSYLVLVGYFLFKTVAQAGL